jgi:PAS domain-containing protein
VDPWAIAAVALAIGFAVAVLAHHRADRRLRRLQTMTGVGATGDPAYGVERLAEHASRLERDLAGERRDRDALVDQIDVGVVELDADLRVTFANAAAHAFVVRAPGTLLGLDLIEAFLDTQLEGIARMALEQGSAAGEISLRGTGSEGPTLVVHARRSAGGGVSLVLDDVSELRRSRR